MRASAALLAALLLTTAARATVVNGLILLKTDDVLYWRARPHASYLGRELNSDGMRDRDFPVAKPAGTVRVAVLGNSVSFGSNVSMEETFAKVLERRLDAGGRRYEVLNFAVPGYTALLMEEQYRRTVSKYRPDVVLICLNSTAVEYELRHHLHGQWLRRRLEDPDPRSLDYASAPYLSVLAQDARAAGLPPARFHPGDFDPRDAVALAAVVVRRLAEEVRADGGRPVLVYVPHLRASEDWAGRFAETARRAGVPYWDVSGPILRDPDRFRFDAEDPHFTAEGHAAVAAELARRVLALRR